MRKFIPFLFLLSLIPMSVSAITVSCSSIAEASSCTRCFRFDLGGSNSANNIFVPRSSIPSGQQEYVDLAKSTISGTTYQGASVSPIGNITNNFDRFASGPNVTASWVWAKTKSGQGVVRNNIPTTVDANRPVYGIRYTSVSHLKNQVSPNAVVPNTEVTQVSCDFFYVKAATSICGNSIREWAEQCDDGNTNNNDACSNACRTPACGNGVREGSEQCDIGTNNGQSGSPCTSQCLNAGATSVCGNGLREGNEQCDDGNMSNTDTCSTTCTVIGGGSPACRVQAFDSYGSIPLTTTLSCSGAQPGRTVIIITKNNTLIDSSETSNKTFTFNEAGRYTIRCYPDAANNQANSCTTVINVDGQCGNGMIESGEQCDDGNGNNFDTCSNSCRLSGSTCGNGILNSGEQCDDGNYNNNDTCTNICQSSTPNTGPMGMMVALMMVAFISAMSIVYYRSRQS
jgi:cysteine-rich repeat protein